MAAGARYNGSTVDEAYYPGRKIAAYTLLDLMVRYDINRAWALQLNARNLTDKTYVSGCDFYCYYGGSRTLDLQLRAPVEIRRQPGLGTGPGCYIKNSC